VRLNGEVIISTGKNKKSPSLKQKETTEKKENKGGNKENENKERAGEGERREVEFFMPEHLSRNTFIPLLLSSLSCPSLYIVDPKGVCVALDSSVGDRNELFRFLQKLGVKDSIVDTVVTTSRSLFPSEHKSLSLSLSPIDFVVDDSDSICLSTLLFSLNKLSTTKVKLGSVENGGEVTSLSLTPVSQVIFTAVKQLISHLNLDSAYFFRGKEVKLKHKSES